MKKVIALIALIASLVLVSAANADRADLIATPSNPTVNQSVVFSGCGYVSGQQIQVQAVYNTKPVTYILQLSETVDANGCFSTNDYSFVIPYSGKWTINTSSYNTGNKIATINLFVT